MASSTLQLNDRFRTLFLLSLILCCSPSIAVAAGPFITVMASGMPAPGAGAGDTFAATYSAVTLNNSGEAAFMARLAGPDVTATNAIGLWSGAPANLSLRVRDGDAVTSPLGPAVWKLSLTPTLNIDSSGNVLFGGDLVGNTTNKAFAVAGIGGVEVAAVIGGQAPGMPPGSTFDGFRPNNMSNSLPPVINAAGQIAVSAITRTTDVGVWSGQAAGLALVARTGNPLPGLPGGNTATAFGPALVNDAGAVAFAATYSIPTSLAGYGIWSGTPGALTPIVHTGDPVPGAPSGVTFAQISTAGYIDFNNSGQTAFYGVANGPGVNRAGYYIGTAGNIQPVLVAGDQAPGLPAGVHVGISPGPLVVEAPAYINNRGDILIQSGFSGPNISSVAGLFAGAPGNMSLIAYIGQQAVGFPDGVKYTVPLSIVEPTGKPVMNDLGQVAFLLSVSTGGMGIWATALDGALHLIVKNGDSIEVTPGIFRTVNAVSFIGSGSGSGGKPTGFNDLGQIAFVASFTDGSTGVFISNAVAVPEPTTVALALLGGLGLLKLKRRRSRKSPSARHATSCTSTWL